MKSVIPMLALAIAAVAPVQASAATLFTTTLSGANETVPNASTATGTGTLTLANDSNSMTVFLGWSGLTGPAQAGHVHCCAVQGVNAPVAIGFAPSAVITGSLSQSFNLTLLSTYSAAFVSANGGTAATAQAAFLAGLAGGKAYFNIHTQQFPGGEIRGQLAAAVPETATWGMMIVGFGIVGGSLRLRRRAAITA